MAIEPSSIFDDIDGDEELLSKYRELTGEYPVEIESDERFRYSQYMFKIYDRQRKYVYQRMKLIDSLFEKFPKHSVAIRTGGEHSAKLYESLSRESREKIGYFIDSNTECLCKKFGLPILVLEEIQQYDVNAIVLSSFVFLEELRKEAKNYVENIEVVDIYKQLELNGMSVKKNFFIDVDMPEEEWEVGYPFDEN